jgi:hypothetical protein
MLLAEIESKLNALTDEQKKPENFGLTLLDVFKSNFGRESRRKITSPTESLSDISKGILLRKWLHYAPCDNHTAENVLKTLEDSVASTKYKTRFLATFDGDQLIIRDAKRSDTLICALSELAENATFLAPLYGQERYEAAEESEIDRQATTQLGRIYDALVKANPEWAKSHTHDLNTFMTRLLFCLFAEDTGIFEKNLITQTLTERAGPKGEHAHDVIAKIFKVLNLPDEQRGETESWLNKFPYVNGDVFDIDDIEVPKFSSTAYRYFMTASNIDWAHVHADILGSSIQKIVDAKTRGELGMHYTSVSNIKKVIDPLFMDELREKLETIKTYKKPIPELHKLLGRIGEIKVFDPACGSGNFLVVAYQSLRELEIDIIDTLRDLDIGQIDAFSRITLNNFYGIEYAEFAAETAKVALRIVEYQMDERYRNRFGTAGVTLPLREAPQIHCGDALILDWDSLLGVKCETYICGNPPFLGERQQSREQKLLLKKVMEDNYPAFKKFDFVCCWFEKAKQCMDLNDKTSAAFVSTNSISQGSHVSNFWPHLLTSNIKISFCHKSFRWSNLAGNNAGVFVVVIAISKKTSHDKFIYDEKTKTKVKNIHPYLIDAPNVFVRQASKPISNLTKMPRGNQLTDDGNLIFTESEVLEIIAHNPESESWFRKLHGGQEILKNIKRFCLYINENNYAAADEIPQLKTRASKIRLFRKNSTDKGSIKLASTPFSFRPGPGIPGNDGKLSIVIPNVSSHAREYFACGVSMSGEVTPAPSFILKDCEAHNLSILSSKIFYVWLKTTSGKLGEGNRFSSTLVWNTFPMPDLTEEQKSDLDKTARGILRAREEFASHLTLGDMYMPDKMPEELKAAHNKNDAVIEKIFNPKGFRNDDARLAHLFERYAEMTKEE